ncbi:MAG: IS256 family transposase [Planctomycetia bacterium]
MTHQDECPAINDLTALLIEHGPAAMASALATLMNHAMQIEREQVLQTESHQRTADRQGYANGFKPKTLKTRVGRVDLRIPQTRDYRDENGRPFYPRALERGVRSERAMTLAVAEMYVQGVSTRKVTAIVEELCGLEITSTQVSRAAAELDEQLSAWRDQSIGEITYLILDARYEKVRHGGAIVPCALLTAIGIGPDSKRSILGCSVQLSEAETHWRSFLQSLVDRGMRGIKLVVSDDHAGLKAARQAVLAGVPWQRCQFHLMQNAMAHVTRYHKAAPQLAAWLEENVPEALTVLRVPAAHRRRLRTTNGLERLNKEIKRRTRVATLFPNEASLLRFASAVLSEISDDWETERAYLTMEAR